ncbi:S-adenosyl-L-methionine-dependent methyltransferase [Dichomitus squalens LYAD-421 SS1]|uniref:S-adenosyl-L-methionine-dependent methyltransferase n=1 Tax=Dichomitus squalens (strain LYAD-421) TaxID=732165 RepID=UPI00044131B3|nr:S-adenosyl-L-methionine-dependent methyltransferase [Dichomitus squalens LYAD-421 SS1]EJF66181.1 S-adenosyl-L-methionine-dependent methyltransferase [Dichomitus squalens LYAD-421 SS1]
MKRSQAPLGNSPAKKARARSDHNHDSSHGPSIWVEIPTRPRNSIAPLRTHYVPVGDELPEDDELVVPGESVPDVDDGEDDDVPIRMLENFAVFDRTTFEFVPVSRLLMEAPSEDWVGAGFVRSVSKDSVDSDDDEDSDFPLVQLSSILEFSVHWVEKNGRSYSLDENVYLLTEHAWYILGSPSSSYAPHYKSFRAHHGLFHILFSCLAEMPNASADKLLNHLPSQLKERHGAHPLCSSVSREALTSQPFVAYLTTVLTIWWEARDQRQQLFQRVVRSPLVKHLYPALPEAFPATDAAEQATVVTPRVGAIAQKLFSQPLRVVQMSEGVRNVPCQAVPIWPVHKGDPQVIEWGEGTEDPHIFKSVVLDGTTYSAGDVVIVDAGEDERAKRAKHAVSASAWCKNNLATKKWFCKINYFFEKYEPRLGWQKLFHAQWLQHGSQTFLQEAAHSRALFWLNECEDLQVECIYSHCNLQPWPPGEAEPLEDDDGPENLFFTGLTLNDTDHSFIHLSTQEIEQALSYCTDELRPCIPCGLDALEAMQEQCIPLESGGVTYRGIDYHVNDFVYHHNSGGNLLHIGQVVEFSDLSCEEPMVQVRRFGRYDHVVKDKAIPSDNRRLFMTDVIISVKMKAVEGKAFVACPSSPWQREQWVKADDHFYCDLFAKSLTPQSLEILQPTALVHCNRCYAAVLEEATEEELLLKTSSKLRGLELFAGAGGLSTGLDLSGFVETRWAVELSESACKTFQANHQSSLVYNQNTSTLLQHVVDTAEGHHPRPLVSKTGTNLPPMPQRGEVDFIYGGPPCQSFSQINHNKKIDDPRSTLACNMISYVEFYRPMYFLLENVRGILNAPTDGQPRDQPLDRNICMGVVKFILRSLTALGYQVHFRILQAGQYGTPQGRQRVIFLGARCDIPLPQFPTPQHDYPKSVQAKNLPDGGVLYPYLRPTGCGQACVSLPAITTEEAIGDLPKFDWKNPHLVIARSRQDVQKGQARLAEGIICVEAVPSPSRSLTGFPTPVAYPQPPLSRFQSWVRGDSDIVTYHYTRRWSPAVVERVVNVPIQPGANHADLPKILQIPCWLNPDGSSKSAYTTVYGRIDNDGCFMTALTTLAPNQKGGKVIHPTQNRIITIREAARAQGFPDSYQFLSIHDLPNRCLDDQARQIGNAVPVPLAAALGKEIGKSLVRLQKQGRDQEKVARLHSPELA